MTLGGVLGSDLAIPIENIDSGVFDLSYGSDTAPSLAYNISASSLQSALNGLTSIIAAGGVTVTGGWVPYGTSSFFVTFNSNGVRPLIQSNSNTLNVPDTFVIASDYQVGSPSLPSIQAITAYCRIPNITARQGVNGVVIGYEFCSTNSGSPYSTMVNGTIAFPMTVGGGITTGTPKALGSATLSFNGDTTAPIYPYEDFFNILNDLNLLPSVIAQGGLFNAGSGNYLFNNLGALPLITGHTNNSPIPQKFYITEITPGSPTLEEVQKVVMQVFTGYLPTGDYYMFFGCAPAGGAGTDATPIHVHWNCASGQWTLLP